MRAFWRRHEATRNLKAKLIGNDSNSSPETSGPVRGAFFLRRINSIQSLAAGNDNDH
jgi:hypothetical protein